MNRAVIGIGSNIDPETNIVKAKRILENEQTLIRESSFTKTKPVGNALQPDFINGALLIESTLTFHELKTYLREVENRLGRIRTADKYSPRTVDLDIVVWNGTIVDDDYYSRDFLINSVHEVLPELP
jgi:2-amino-4-hydroxy-6-hydroxymethyldihydropteridine diphosphokinase